MAEEGRGGGRREREWKKSRARRMDGWKGRERERGLGNRHRDDRWGRPVTEDERVREKEGISFPLRDDKA